MRANRKTRDHWDEEFDLVQNNGRVTLPATSRGLYAIGNHLPILILLGASLLIALFAARK